MRSDESKAAGCAVAFISAAGFARKRQAGVNAASLTSQHRISTLCINIMLLLQTCDCVYVKGGYDDMFYILAKESYVTFLVKLIF